MSPSQSINIGIKKGVVILLLVIGTLETKEE